MKTIACKWVKISLFLCSLWFISCEKNDIELIDSSYKTLKVSCGDDFEISVLANNWSVESVENLTNLYPMQDKNGNLLTLAGNGKVEASNGWFALTRDREDKFTISLKENFDKSNERKFVICINDDAGHRDYVTVIQQAGTGYKLVKSIYEEIEEQREIYVSGEECAGLSLHSGSAAFWQPYRFIFDNILESSNFESNDYGAFDWIPNEGVKLSVPQLIIDNSIWWDNICTYERGTTTTPAIIKDIPDDAKVWVQPYSALYLRGEATYCKRVCNYTFTIQNVETGTQFDINGIWTQIVVLKVDTIFSDTPF